MPQTISNPFLTLFLGYQFLNRGKEQKYACETILSIRKLEETFLFFPRYLALLFNRAFFFFFWFDFFFFFQHGRWMGEPRKLHSKKCLLTVLTLVWHVTYLAISGRGNIPSKLWAWRETGWMVSKHTQYLSNFWSSQKPTFQFGKPAGGSSILPNHELLKATAQGGSGNHFPDLLPKLAKIKWLAEGRRLYSQENRIKRWCPKPHRHVEQW